MLGAGVATDAFGTPKDGIAVLLAGAGILVLDPKLKEEIPGVEEGTLEAGVGATAPKVNAAADAGAAFEEEIELEGAKEKLLDDGLEALAPPEGKLIVGAGVEVDVDAPKENVEDSAVADDDVGKENPTEEVGFGCIATLSSIKRFFERFALAEMLLISTFVGLCAELAAPKLKGAVVDGPKLGTVLGGKVEFVRKVTFDFEAAIFVSLFVAGIFFDPNELEAIDEFPAILLPSFEAVSFFDPNEKGALSPSFVLTFLIFF